MSTEENKDLVRRFVREVFVEGRTDSVEELVADDSARTRGDRRGQARRT
jgi:hypothetical protein